MALKKQENYMGFEFEAYLKITAMIIWKNGDVAIDLASYKDKNQTSHYKLEQFYFKFPEQEDMTFAKAYACLKLVPRLAGISDVLEKGQVAEELTVIPEVTFSQTI